jgi:hypothetical protein
MKVIKSILKLIIAGVASLYAIGCIEMFLREPHSNMKIFSGLITLIIVLATIFVIYSLFKKKPVKKPFTYYDLLQWQDFARHYNYRIPHNEEDVNILKYNLYLDKQRISNRNRKRNSGGLFFPLIAIISSMMLFRAWNNK